MLRITSPERSIHLPPGSYLLGRTLPCHLLLQERTVSGEHCRIWSHQGQWYIKDLGSTNGTLLDDLLLIKNLETLLPRRAQIKLGIIALNLEWDQAEGQPIQESFPIILLNQNEETSTINQKNLYNTFSTLSDVIAIKLGHIEISSRNPIMRRMYDEARELATTHLPVAIEGETGTGKELLARYIHQHSGRKGTMVTLVPTTNEPLQESEFFGYRKGAFTGADHDYPGKIKLADSGTLFLDELSHIPHSLQVRLLRFLENGEIFPLGARHAETVEVRLLVASNVPFIQLVRDGTLREDFYYRLCVNTLPIPPLRQRPEDILPLFSHFFGSDCGIIPEDFAICLLRHPWPGNVRELKAEAQRLRLKVKRIDQLTPQHLGTLIRTQYPTGPKRSPLSDISRDQQERRFIENALKDCHGNKSQAADLLKISRRGLYKKMKRLGMED